MQETLSLNKHIVWGKKTLMKQSSILSLKTIQHIFLLKPIPFFTGNHHGKQIYFRIE